MLRFDLKARLADDTTPGGLSERIASVIQGCIEEGEFSVGKRLPAERELAEIMEVSRTSVRAAIQKLKTQGLISAVQGGGTRVADHLPLAGEALARYAASHGESLERLIDMRFALDCWAARQAVQTITSSQLARMHRALQVMQDLEAPRSQVMQAVADFRAAWSEAVGSPIFAFVDRSIADTLIHLTGVAAQEKRLVFPETRLLIKAARDFHDALSERDSEAAIAALELHRQAMLGYPKLKQDEQSPVR